LHSHQLVANVLSAVLRSPSSSSAPCRAPSPFSSSKRCPLFAATKLSKRELNTARSHIYIWEIRLISLCKCFCIVLCRASIFRAS
jgi:hypothetical protein